MKSLLAALFLALAVNSHAYNGPYFQGLWGKNLTHPQTSLGAVFDSKGNLISGAFTNVAIVYHSADPDNSLIPTQLQSYLPPESWTLLNFGYGGSIAGFGASINLAATVQGYASEAFSASANPSLQAFGGLIKPGTSPVSINAGPEWFSAVVRNSTLLPFDQWKGVPGWFVGGAYKF